MVQYPSSRLFAGLAVTRAAFCASRSRTRPFRMDTSSRKLSSATSASTTLRMMSSRHDSYCRTLWCSDLFSFCNASKLFSCFWKRTCSVLCSRQTCIDFRSLVLIALLMTSK
uniref:Putative secreted protein n=1 Tax=Anopheles triannulatus TaxID=58253 RepID=A0A2M4B6P6_9DIPT